MAAPMRNLLSRRCFQSLNKNLKNCSKGKHQTSVSISIGRAASSQGPKSSNECPEVAVSPDGSTILCWHPQPQFPYQHTKPLPRRVEQVAEGDSALKVQYLTTERLKHREDGPSDKELANIFFTSKHRWYPKPEKKYRKVRTPKDRDRL